MSRIDFYFIPQQGPQARLQFACRLLEKAYQQGAGTQTQIYVHTENAEKARFFDQLLWIYRDDSFIPHHLAPEQSDIKQVEQNSPIQIGSGPQPNTQSEILLNLDNEIPAFYSQFKRILEIIPNEPALLTLAQEHRVFFEEKGYTINSHQLTK